ncbi:TnsA endonuclease N-terminal domain-containing protein [Pseudoalteromonas spongiae]|uniref:TnsA endonuclease N-terminal domain-containing protein n=1 Tax=Pseudoalteromonas spongiae TaxID=298657 RepID=UPI00110A613F|nr:TnsA endonuclease N-terminal domain-containing protein [Pseudoalteromonas spongiae]TMO84839.1 hypothetical protein CWC15_09655 [Pseudoalteromonas spongiae]
MRKQLKGVTLKRQKNWIDKHEESLLVGNSYIPFWTVHDVRSSGVKCKIKHFREDRVVHLLSQNEVCQFMLLAFDQTVIDTKEQFALPLAETLVLAKELDVKHPVYPGTKVPIVQTIDFICDINTSKKGIAVKQHDEIFKVRSVEKLAIQEAYCAKRGFEFEITTSKDLKIEPVRNLERMYRHAKLNPLLKPMLADWLDTFLVTIEQAPDERASKLLRMSADKVGIDFSIAAHFFYHSIWHHRIDINWERPLFLEFSAFDLGLARIKADIAA